MRKKTSENILHGLPSNLIEPKVFTMTTFLSPQRASEIETNSLKHKFRMENITVAHERAQ